MGSGSPTENTRFEAVDWDEVSADTPGVRWNVRAFVAGLGLLVLGYAYERVTKGQIVPGATLSFLDWLTTASLLALAAFVVVPLVRDRETTLQYWHQFRSDRLGVASLLFLFTFFVVGLVGPVFVSRPELALLASYQPPVGTSLDMGFLTSCVGPVVDGRCHGTWQYPLGTTYTGEDLVPYVVFGARTTLQIALVSSALLVPTGVAVGLIAAHAGDRIDAILMQISEIFQTTPTILIYLVLWPWVNDHKLLMMIAVFGLTSWGSIARLVRNEARKLSEELYVRAAEGTGATRRAIVCRHLLPNVSGSVLTNATLQIPMLILIEAALSFLGLGDPQVFSWGQTIAMGILDFGVYPAWWITAVPAVLLSATVLAFNVFGDALTDALDPHNRH